MRKVEISLPVSGQWGQTNTKYPSNTKLVASDDFTRGTQNVETNDKGVIRKRDGSVDYAVTQDVVMDQYEAVFSSGVRHLITVDRAGTMEFSPGDQSNTSVATSLGNPGLFEFDMYDDRVYMGNRLTPKVYDNTVAYGGVTYTAPKLRDMGCQPPSGAPTAPATGSGSSGAVPNGPHTYKVTFMYYEFEESNGSTASGVCTVTGPASTVSLTAVPTGGYGVTSRKIYRDDNDGVYVYIGSIADNTTTTFSDTVASGGALVPIDNNLPPAFGLVTQFLDRLFLGAIPSDPFTLYFTETGFPDIVKPLNFVLCSQKDPMTGIVVYRDRLIIFNRNSMGQILGRTKSEFRYVSIEEAIGCIDNRTIQVRTVNGVPELIWLGEKGLYSYNGNSVQYLSDTIEDVMRVNIQQAAGSRGRNTQTTQSDFEVGAGSDSYAYDTQEQTSGADSWTVPSFFNLAEGDTFGVDQLDMADADDRDALTEQDSADPTHNFGWDPSDVDPSWGSNFPENIREIGLDGTFSGMQTYNSAGNSVYYRIEWWAYTKNKIYNVYFFADGIGMCATSDDSTPMDVFLSVDTSVAHSYRFVVLDDGTVDAYVDGVLLGNLGAGGTGAPYNFFRFGPDDFCSTLGFTKLWYKTDSRQKFYTISYSTNAGNFYNQIKIWADGITSSGSQNPGVAADLTGAHDLQFVVNAVHGLEVKVDNVVVGTLAASSQPAGSDSIVFDIANSLTDTISRQWVTNRTLVSASTGVDITSIPGSITIPPTFRRYDDETDWNQAGDGSERTNVTTSDASTMSMPRWQKANAAEGTGTLLGDFKFQDSEVRFDVASVFSGQSGLIGSTAGSALPRSGTLHTVTVHLPAFIASIGGTPVTSDPNLQVFYRVFDNATQIYQSGNISQWLYRPSAVNSTHTLDAAVLASHRITVKIYALNVSSSFELEMNYSGGDLTWDYAFVQNASALEGTWQTPWFDSKSLNPTDLDVSFQFASVLGVEDPTTISGSFVLESSVDGEAITQTTSRNIDFAGYPTLTFTGSTLANANRYWRVTLTIRNSDDTKAFRMTGITIKSGTSATWITDLIDCEPGVTSFDSLVLLATHRSDITMTMLVSDNGEDFTEVSFSSGMTVHRYVRLKLAFTRDNSVDDPPIVTSLLFTYTSSGTMLGYIINTGVTPVAWDVFQATVILGGGTVSFSMRTASTEAGIATATWIDIASGGFPSNDTLQFVQWRVTITNSGTSTPPEVQDVTVSWLTAGIGTTIRAASLFFQQVYYLSVAENGQESNNLIIALDPQDKLRFYYGCGCRTLSFFFNSMYGGLSVDSKIIKLVEGLTDSSTPVVLDFRTKAFDFSEDGYDNAEFDKIFKEAIVTIGRTGTTYRFYFSADNGETWNTLYTYDGSSSYPTTNTGDRVTIRLQPHFDFGNTVQGKTLMFRAVSDDEFAAEIHRVKIKAWIRRGELHV
jgi:hypothetical protein